MAKIRVLHVVTHMNRGGIETMLMNYYRNIDRNVIQFDFLVHRHDIADYDSEITSLGGKIFRLSRLIPWSKSYIRELNTFFSTHPEYRIVHVHQDCLSSVVLNVAKKHGVPVRIAHSHCTGQDLNAKYFIKLAYKLLIPCTATDLLACSTLAGEWMFGNAKFGLMKNAIDASKYAFDANVRLKVRSSLNVPDNALVLGHVGRFSWPKNHNYLVKIFRDVKNRHNNAYLLLVGDGELFPRIRKQVDDYGLSDSVIFAGVSECVADLLQAMDVFVFPSRYEGLGMSIIEAQNSGLPCVISQNIPAECDISPFVYRVSLSEPVKVWSNRILDCAFLERQNNTMFTIGAGYDIAQNSDWLQEYYLAKWSE